ncbi:MAG TPA: 4-hydroxybenzoate 3-monooxygenase [Mycobacteriales bacterium]|nr:4-hydroxybenzoate 3-monooxygenase [Mycobacteriales bacterium]
MRTRVAIIGAGPAGLMLSHLLDRCGIDSVVLELRSREYLEQRVRAGVLESPTVQLLRDVGLGARLDTEGLPHQGFSLRFDREDHRIALNELTGKHIVVYGQQEVVKDLIRARLAAGGQLEFEVTDVTLHDIAASPWVGFTDHGGRRQELHADVLVGADGFHGISRHAYPKGAWRAYDKQYPFAWLGILAQTPPSHEELIYAYTEHGFALHSMRSPAVTRLYLQVAPDEDLANWPDARIWAELELRLALREGNFALTRGPILDRGITAMRSFVAEPMRHGRLFLAGDAAHIVPPTGAKGMNLAIADVSVLAAALEAFFSRNEERWLASYSSRCLRRVWRAEQFSSMMTTMLHIAPTADPFDRQLQLSQLRYIATSAAAATSLAENYVGLPLSDVAP